MSQHHDARGGSSSSAHMQLDDDINAYSFPESPMSLTFHAQQQQQLQQQHGIAYGGGYGDEDEVMTPSSDFAGGGRGQVDSAGEEEPDNEDDNNDDDDEGFGYGTSAQKYHKPSRARPTGRPVGMGVQQAADMGYDSRGKRHPLIHEDFFNDFGDLYDDDCGVILGGDTPMTSVA
ncbi:hypothetical protein RI367_005748 [Sorochytrium milnesiophthora]